MSNDRIAPVEPPFSEPVRTALDRIMPEGVPPLMLFRTLAVNERVFLRTMAGGLLDRGSITLRDRELVILRTCARLGSEYEWGVHVTFFGGKAELSAAETAATRAALTDDGAFSPRERLLIRVVDELVDTSQVSDALYEELCREWSREQLVEIVALTGFYHLIAFTTNAFRVPLEPFAARFPPPTD
jgi:4-carboxymuconolactone decarboxylase